MYSLKPKQTLVGSNLLSFILSIIQCHLEIYTSKYIVQNNTFSCLQVGLYENIHWSLLLLFWTNGLFSLKKVLQPFSINDCEKMALAMSLLCT